MDIYKQKQNWKKLLLFIAASIIALSFWYTNQLVKNIAEEERKEVQLWAEAVRKKAKLVSYTQKLFVELREEERKKVELWVEANKRLTSTAPNLDLPFLTKILTDNTTVPVIWTGKDGNVKATRNLSTEIKNSPEALKKEIEVMKALHPPIEIVYLEDQIDYLYYKDSRIFEELKHTFSDLEQSFISEVVSNSASVPAIITDDMQKKILYAGNINTSSQKESLDTNTVISEMKFSNQPISINLQGNTVNYVMYQDSWILTQLRYYPFVQIGIIGLFILIGYYFFSSSRRAEQNRVWVGMAKETAHQLGTPLSSLLGWVEYIKLKGDNDTLAKELEKDVQRLEIITDRFSKIGSLPELKPNDLIQTLEQAIAYHKTRSPKSIDFIVHNSLYSKGEVMLSPPLFNWVIENLVRNAIDAMGAKGIIELNVMEDEHCFILDVKDNGKGMNSNLKKSVFDPGVTSKKRGWGLGLTLSKRIIEEYHKGKITVKESKLGEGTTFRITLNKA